MICDVLKICDNLQIKGFLMVVDTEKAFDSINRCFLIKVLEKYGLKKILSSGLRYYYKIKNHAS